MTNRRRGLPTPEQAERRRLRREARRQGVAPPLVSPPAQLGHATSGKARRRAREGEERVERQRRERRPGEGD